MRRLVLKSIAGIAIAAYGCAAGEGNDGETGGRAGAGGSRAGNGGANPNGGKGGANPNGGKGGLSPTGGRGGTGPGEAGGGNGGGGTAGEAGEGGGGGERVCSARITEPMPWLYVDRVKSGEDGAGGAPGNDAAVGGAGGSGGESSGAPCVGTPQESGGLRCEGFARVRVREDGLRLVFADGSVLRATSTLASEPFLANETVWVRYDEAWFADCPFCGGRSRRSLEARTAPGGSVLTFAQGGELSPAIGDVRGSAIPRELLGASLGSRLGCTYEFDFDCNRVRRTLYDYQLTTTPPQPIPHGTVTRVTSVDGEPFDILISRAQQTTSHDPNCFDGQTPPVDDTLIVSRVRTH